MSTYLTRSDWGAAAPRDTLVPLDKSRVEFWTAHFDGSRPIGDRDPTALMRAFQRYHQYTRNFVDIAYNSAAFQNGWRAEGRGAFRGGHLLGSQNSVSWGCIGAVGVDEEPTPALYRAMRADYDAAVAWAGHYLKPMGHTQWPDANKSCPGRFFMDWLRAGMPVDNVPIPTVPPLVATEPLPGPVVLKPGLTPPPFPLGRCRRHNKQMWYGPKSDLDHQVSGWANRQADGTKGADGLAQFQRHMRDYRGWDITPDGLWGDKTDRVVRLFQTQKGLTPDGALGPDTWAKAWSEPVTND